LELKPFNVHFGHFVWNSNHFNVVHFGRFVLEFQTISTFTLVVLFGTQNRFNVLWSFCFGTQTVNVHFGRFVLELKPFFSTFTLKMLFGTQTVPEFFGRFVWNSNRFNVHFGRLFGTPFQRSLWSFVWNSNRFNVHFGRLFGTQTVSTFTLVVLFGTQPFQRSLWSFVLELKPFQRSLWSFLFGTQTVSTFTLVVCFGTQTVSTFSLKGAGYDTTYAGSNGLPVLTSYRWCQTRSSGHVVAGRGSEASIL
jgi:hypothetical protein